MPGNRKRLKLSKESLYELSLVAMKPRSMDHKTNCACAYPNQHQTMGYCSEASVDDCKPGFMARRRNTRGNKPGNSATC